MIIDNIDKVLDGTKTQTRCIVKAGQHFPRDQSTEKPAVVDGKDRLVWMHGYDYAVQPGSGQRAVGRIRITGIREEDVRNISDEDVKAEGFACKEAFLATWLSMHDKAICPDSYVYMDMGQSGDNPGAAWWTSAFYLDIAQRPTERYQAWALTFELVEVQS